MSRDQSLNHRLINLAKLLEQAPAPGLPTKIGRAELVAARLAAVADDRLRLLGETLKERRDEGEMDAGDALLLRLLLEDYRAGVGHLRAIANSIDERLTAARNTIRDGRRAVTLERSYNASPSETQKT